MGLLLFVPKVHGQSGWVRGEEGSYTQITVSAFSSNNFYSVEGELDDQGPTYQQFGLQYYGEYGLNKHLTATVDFPVLLINRFSNTTTVAGTGGMRLGLKGRLLKQFPLAAQLELDIPTNGGNNIATTLEANDQGMIEQVNLPTSDGEFNLWATLAASQSLPNGKTYGSMFASLNVRTQGFSPQMKLGVELGHLFADRVYLIGKLQLQDQLTDSDENRDSFLFGEGTTFTYYNLSTFVKISDHARIVASVANFNDWLVARRNLYGGATYLVGVAFEY